jgi:D-alanyl-D-alanine carboxypeptidase
MQSYLNKTFVIDDPQARIRPDNDLLTYVMEDGKPKVIPQGTAIRVTDTSLLKESVFVNAENWGWTAANNLKGKFLNETLATFEPQDVNPKGSNAAWDAGKFIKQITLIQIVGADNTLKFISSDIAEFYFALVNAAEADGVPLPLKSGFRTYPKQQALYDGYIKKQPGFNLAAKPGFSNHEDGYAYDFAIGGYEGNPRYDWLKAHAPKHGFVRTVDKEPWHWEYRPNVAATGAFKAPNVTT